jgi:hypothetical protein
MESDSVVSVRANLCERFPLQILHPGTQMYDQSSRKRSSTSRKISPPTPKLTLSPTTIYFQIVPGVEDYWLQTWILLTYGFLGSFSVLITVGS